MRTFDFSWELALVMRRIGWKGVEGAPAWLGVMTGGMDSLEEPGFSFRCSDVVSCWETFIEVFLFFFVLLLSFSFACSESGWPPLLPNSSCTRPFGWLLAFFFIRSQLGLTERSLFLFLSLSLSLFFKAKTSLSEGEVPVGCVIVKDQVIVGRGRNRPNFSFNVTLLLF